MKTVAVLALVAVLLLPGIALAGPSTDAALEAWQRWRPPTQPTA